MESRESAVKHTLTHFSALFLAPLAAAGAVTTYPTPDRPAAAEPDCCISNEQVSVEVDTAASTVALRVPGSVTPFASGPLRARATGASVGSIDLPGLGHGHVITVSYADGGRDDLAVVSGVPFALLRPTFANLGAASTVLDRLPVLDLFLNLGQSQHRRRPRLPAAGGGEVRRRPRGGVVGSL